MRAFGRWWTALLIVGCVIAAPSSEENKGNSMEDASSAVAGVVDTVADPVTSVVEEAAANSGLFGPQLRAILGALENVDEMLRTTLPSIDKFQCVERVLCSVMSAGGSLAGSPSSSSPVSSALAQAFDPTFQQGFIQNPELVQQDILQNPSFQQGLQQLFSQNSGLSGLQSVFNQNPAALQQVLQGIVSENPEALQQGITRFLTQNPSALTQGLQQVFSQASSPTQQSFAPPNPAFQQGFAHTPTFQTPSFAPPPPPGFHQFQSPTQTFHQPFQSTFPNFRENQDTHSPQTTIRRTSAPHRRRRPQRRNGFREFLDRLGLGKRKKRGILDDIASGFTSLNLMGMVDTMMNGYSFYPYTHAAYMGYNGASKRCESLYPKCPSTPEEMIDIFNNIHRHYPDGFPYKEQMPWLLKAILP